MVRPVRGVHQTPSSIEVRMARWPGGDPEAISARVQEQFDADADQVALSVLGTPGGDSLEIRRELAATLIK